MLVLLDKNGFVETECLKELVVADFGLNPDLILVVELQDLDIVLGDEQVVLVGLFRQ